MQRIYTQNSGTGMEQDEKNPFSKFRNRNENLSFREWEHKEFPLHISWIWSLHMAKYAKYAYLGAYLGAPNIVKWGVPEKILQNAVQTRWS